MDQINTILRFLIIDNFDGLATILTIGGAIYLYLRSKREFKQQIATLLVSDIRNADTSIEKVRDAFDKPIVNRSIPDITVLPENNWKKYSHLFSKDFDEDETSLLNLYFASVERISFIVTQSNNIFLQTVSARTNALQKENMRILASSRSLDEVNKKLQELDKRFASGVSTSPYSPQFFYDNLGEYLPKVPSVLTSSAGKKLKKIAGLL